MRNTMATSNASTNSTSMSDSLSVQNRRLDRPKTVSGGVFWFYAIPISALHVLSLLAFWPWIFSWSGLAMWAVGVHLFGDLGINLCYHRMLAHRSLKVPKWLERSFVVIAICCLQDTPVKWVTNHRLHHQHSDEQPDPHSPMVSFIWSHFEWLYRFNSYTWNAATYERYAKDLLRDPFYFLLERTYLSAAIYASSLVLYFVAGLLTGYAYSGNWTEGLRLGLSWFIWGGVFRTVAVWHITWSVNSLTHLFGYRTYETSDNSRNNWLVALLASGEGWHNNHHQDPTSASVQHRWWEIDVTYYTILLLEAVGLAKDVVRPRRNWANANENTKADDKLAGQAAKRAEEREHETAGVQETL